MSREVNKDDCIPEIDRFFRKYYVFCQSPDPDVVREVIFSAYSLNDKLRKSGYPNFFKNEYFVAIKAIRNYVVHQSELSNKVRSLPLMSPVPIEADISILCLIPRSIIDNICKNSNSESVLSINKTCIFYSKYIDIYPCLFNFGVELYFYLKENELEINSKEYSDMSNSIKHEVKNGYPHFVKGGITLSDGSLIDDFIENSLITMEERERQQSIYYSEEGGMYTFNINSIQAD